METINTKRTTQYGIQLNDDTYRNTTEAVKTFLKNKLPAKLEITEMDGKKISKVKILKSINEENNTEKNLDMSRIVGTSISYAKDLAVAGIIKPEQIAEKAKGFVQLHKELI